MRKEAEPANCVYRQSVKCTGFDAAAHTYKTTEANIAATGRMACANENQLKELLTENSNNAGFFSQDAAASPVKSADVSCKHSVDAGAAMPNVVRMKFSRPINGTALSLETEGLQQNVAWAANGANFVGKDANNAPKWQNFKVLKLKAKSSEMLKMAGAATLTAFAAVLTM